jgi:hypothetical protein
VKDKPSVRELWGWLGAYPGRNGDPVNKAIWWATLRAYWADRAVFAVIWAVLWLVIGLIVARLI